MITKNMVYLNGVGLHELDDRIVTQAINEARPMDEYTLVSRASRIGQNVTGYERQALDVAVTFSIRDIYHYEDRAEILDRVKAWAASGGFLTVNYRPGKAMRVYCYQMPDIGSVKEWTQNYTINFRASAVPYWEESEVTEQSVQALPSVDVNTALNMPGTAETVLQMNMTAMGSVDAVTVSTERDSITLSGLKMKNGDVLNMEESGGILHIKVNDENVHRLRTADSSDEIRLLPGENPITVTASGGASVSVFAYGRWL